MCGKYLERSSQMTKPAKRPKPKRPTEDQEQIILADYLDLRYGYFGWIHVPNQRWAKLAYLVKLRRMGVKKGFPDIIILKHKIFIELKRVGGKRPEEEQVIWMEKLNEECGWTGFVAYGAKDAILKLEGMCG